MKIIDGLYTQTQASIPRKSWPKKNVIYDGQKHSKNLSSLEIPGSEFADDHRAERLQDGSSEMEMRFSPKNGG